MDVQRCLLGYFERFDLVGDACACSPVTAPDVDSIGRFRAEKGKTGAYKPATHRLKIYCLLYIKASQILPRLTAFHATLLVKMFRSRGLMVKALVFGGGLLRNAHRTPEIGRSNRPVIVLFLASLGTPIFLFAPEWFRNEVPVKIKVWRAQVFELL